MPRLATRAESLERRERMVSMLLEGVRAADVAKHFGVERSAIHYALAKCGKLLPQTPTKSVRNVHESMFEREWEGICMHHRALTDACREPAAWESGEFQVCEKHYRRNADLRRIVPSGAGVALAARR